MKTWQSNFYNNKWSEIEDFYQLEENNLMSNLWTLDWKNVVSALVSSVLSAVLMYLSNLTNLTDFNWHMVLFIAITVGATSLLKNFGTTASGNFLGTISVK
jgi:hypothetical protein